MLQSLLRQPLGRLSFSLNILRGVAGVARLPLYSIRTRDFLTSAHQLKENQPAVTKTKRVVTKAKTTKTVATVPKAKRKRAKKVVPKEPKLFKKDVVPPVKRPLYGFALFVKNLRAERGSKEGLTPILYEASPKWKALTDEEKLKYTLEPGAMERYIQKIREWRSGLSPKERKVLGLKAKVTPRPLSAYQMVIREVFNQKQGRTFLESSTLALETYKNMTPEQKEQYKQMAQAEFKAQNTA